MLVILSSYQKIRRLDVSELRSFPILARGSAVRFLLTRLYDFVYAPKNALVNHKDPLEFLKKLRFHQKITSFKDYGIV